MGKAEKIVNIEIDFNEKDLLWLAMQAHDKDITLNQLINEMLTKFIVENKDGKNND